MSKPLAVEDLAYIAERCQAIGAELGGAQIFITGGTGFFGCWLLESLLYLNRSSQLNAHVTVLSRNPAAFARKMPHLMNDPALAFIQGDVRDFVFPSQRFTHVIHAATEASAALNRLDPLQMVDVIVRGTQRTLEFSRICGAQNVLLVSSGAVYGRQPSTLSHIAEDYEGSLALANPGNAYGVGKRTAEHLAHLYADQHGLNVKIARCFAFVGPHLPLDAHFAIGNFIRNGLNGETIGISGDGTPYRSYQYAADLMVWLWHILVRGAVGRPYNVGSDHAISILELAELVANCFEPSLPIKVAQPWAGLAPERYVPSVERIQAELSVSNGVSLLAAIQKTLVWYQS